MECQRWTSDNHRRTTKLKPIGSSSSAFFTGQTAVQQEATLHTQWKKHNEKTHEVEEEPSDLKATIRVVGGVKVGESAIRYQ
jgi:hypothetical protein